MCSFKQMMIALVAIALGSMMLACGDFPQHQDDATEGGGGERVVLGGVSYEGEAFDQAMVMALDHDLTVVDHDVTGPSGMFALEIPEDEEVTVVAGPQDQSLHYMADPVVIMPGDGQLEIDFVFEQIPEENFPVTETKDEFGTSEDPLLIGCQMWCAPGWPDMICCGIGFELCFFAPYCFGGNPNTGF